jgi:YegS/Rv2252/BmrU family lipid kinase
MKKAALLYNPLSGRGRHRRLRDIKAVTSILRDAGIEVTAVPTVAGEGACAGQAREAIAQGCDTVFACGGDGTVHDILQGMAGASAALGIIPLGTANALAHDLRIPLSPAAAARAALTFKPRRIAIGKVTYQDFSGKAASRYFTVTLGAGVDAHLFHHLDPAMKLRFGMLAYYLKATWLWLTHALPAFPVEFGAVDGSKHELEVSELLAVRIRNFGGVLRELAPGASLERDDFRLVLFRTRSRLRYLAYIFRGLVGARWKISGIDLAHSASIVVPAQAGAAPTYVEADGEILGTTPAEITLAPDAVSLLAPEN